MLARWTLGGAVAVVIMLTPVVTWVHLALAFIATTCAALATRDD